MYIPSLASDYCPMDLISQTVSKRSFTSSVVSTADSFKSWDTCMDNKTCKIIAIVGIVLASLVGLWLICTVFSLLCCGVSYLTNFCCGCCSAASRKRNARKMNRKLNKMGKNGKRGSAFSSPQTSDYRNYQPPSAVPPSYAGFEKIQQKGNSYGYGVVYDDDDDFSADNVPFASKEKKGDASSTRSFASEYYAGNSAKMSDMQNTNGYTRASKPPSYSSYSRAENGIF